MLISIDDAGRALGDLVSDVEAGGDVVLTRGGRAVARLVAVDAPSSDRPARRAVIQAARVLAQRSIAAAGAAAQSLDTLYTDDGLPG